MSTQQLQDISSEMRKSYMNTADILTGLARGLMDIAKDKMTKDQERALTRFTLANALTAQGRADVKNIFAAEDVIKVLNDRVYNIEEKVTLLGAIKGPSKNSAEFAGKAIQKELLPLRENLEKITETQKNLIHEIDDVKKRQEELLKNYRDNKIPSDTFATSLKASEEEEKKIHAKIRHNLEQSKLLQKELIRLDSRTTQELSTARGDSYQVTQQETKRLE